jgi:hypothetical protein
MTTSAANKTSPMRSAVRCSCTQGPTGPRTAPLSGGSRDPRRRREPGGDEALRVRFGYSTTGLTVAANRSVSETWLFVQTASTDSGTDTNPSTSRTAERPKPTAPSDAPVQAEQPAALPPPRATAPVPAVPPPRAHGKPRPLRPLDAFRHAAPCTGSARCEPIRVRLRRNSAGPELRADIRPSRPFRWSRRTRPASGLPVRPTGSSTPVSRRWCGTPPGPDLRLPSRSSRRAPRIRASPRPARS